MKSKTNFASRLATYLMLFGITFFCAFQASGEEWTAEQKEVWSLVQAAWENFKNSDVESVVQNAPKNAVTWWGSEASPYRWEELKTAYQRWFRFEKIINSELLPLRIEIFDDVAVVAYYASWKSDKRSAKTRFLSVYQKQGDNWSRIGSLSSACNRPPKCME